MLHMKLRLIFHPTLDFPSRESNNNIHSFTLIPSFPLYTDLYTDLRNINIPIFEPQYRAIQGNDLIPFVH